MLKQSYYNSKNPHPKLGDLVLECGLDEAGAGPLMGPVVAAAVVWPPQADEEFTELQEYLLIKDSKKLSKAQRDRVSTLIKCMAIDYSVAFVDNSIIDKINIYQSRFLAMRQAIASLTCKPNFLLVDGNRFISGKETKGMEWKTVVKGDGEYQSIAAASILAKCARDDYVEEIAKEYPEYGWEHNKGYGTADHFDAIEKYGITPFHRKSFNLKKKNKQSKDRKKARDSACEIESDSE